MTAKRFKLIQGKNTERMIITHSCVNLLNFFLLEQLPVLDNEYMFLITMTDINFSELQQ